jgi:hypothetical protein
MLYDLMSIMHYQLNSFSSSVDLNTIRVLEARSQVRQRKYCVYSDEEKMKVTKRAAEM